MYLREDERRELTTRAAIRLIARDGMTAASLRNIALEAGVPLSSLHYVYPDKDSLLTDTLRRSAELVADMLNEVEIDENGATLEEAIGCLITSLVTQVVADSPAQRAQYELFLWAVRSPEAISDALGDLDFFLVAFEKFLVKYAQDVDVDLPFLSGLVAAQVDGLILQALSGHPMDKLIERRNQLAAGLIAAASR